MYESKVQENGLVTFPEFTGERVYMLPFFQKEGLPENLKRWQPTIDQMLDGVMTDQPIYLMIDQAFVSAGKNHRRPGLHIDGYWNPSGGHDGHKVKSSLAGSHGGHKSNSGLYLGSHGIKGGHAPTDKKKKKGSHGGSSHGSKPSKGYHGGGHGAIHGSGPQSWAEAIFKEHEALILASNITASRGFVGSFEGPIKDMGDCGHIETKNLKEVILEAGKAYTGNVTFLHESLPAQEDGYRTLVRLNVPGLNF